MLLGMFFHEFFILVLVDLLWALLMGLGHLLTHDLGEGIVAALRVEPTLRWLFLLFHCFLLLSLNL